jgi:predicted pyridoxine 5'-phosphate oxidase superfamily flavin-nucleotide-binding protein
LLNDVQAAAYGVGQVTASQRVRLQAGIGVPGAPRLVIEVSVTEAYLHCAKAFMRSRLWSADAQVPRSALPTMGQMLRDQIGDAGPIESQEDMLARYQAEL